MKEFTPDQLGDMIGRSGQFIRKAVNGLIPGIVPPPFHKVGNHYRFPQDEAKAWAIKNNWIKPQPENIKTVRTTIIKSKKLEHILPEPEEDTTTERDWTKVSLKNYPRRYFVCVEKIHGCRLIISEKHKTGFIISIQSSKGDDHFVSRLILNAAIDYHNKDYFMRFVLEDLNWKYIFEERLDVMVQSLIESGIQPRNGRGSSLYFVIDSEGYWYS